MLTDEEARAIEDARKHGGTEPARLARWVDDLLTERREMRAQLEYIRTRLQQAATYLDRLFIRPAPSAREIKRRSREQR